MSARAARWAALLAALLAAAASLLPAAPVRAATAVEGPASPVALAQMWTSAETQLTQASADQRRLAAQAPAMTLFSQARHLLQLEDAAFRFRDGARAEQVVIYAMAVDEQVDAATEPLLPPAQLPPVRNTIAGLQALWRSAGITDLSAIRIRYNRDYTRSEPVDKLASLYQVSGSRYSVDWSYLASINYVESDFGRVNGPSSAGAMGPMQFMPATWQSYGQGGDIMNPHDSIDAAARYLKAMGAPGSMDRAIFRYNNDNDYVASIESFAAAFRGDPGWLDRVYYWSTAG
jgi:membrane-bound lytic murein transglycosylase B